MKPLRIALIGSRDLERHAQYHVDIPLCIKVCHRLAVLGHTFTSGLCAQGMDGLAQKAYSMAVEEGLATLDQFEVYVKDQGEITRSSLPNKHVARVRNPDLIQETEALVESVLGSQHWNNCNAWARGMHSRNCHQILGYTLQDPVDCVITWTPGGQKKGGTKTALLIAEKYSIPVFNLGLPDKNHTLLQIKTFLDNH